MFSERHLPDADFPPTSLQVVYRGDKTARHNIRKFDWTRPPAKDWTDEDPPALGPAFSSTSSYSSSSASSAVARDMQARRRRHLKFNVLVTSYDFVIRDSSILARMPWEGMIIDEAQRIKNKDSELFTKLVKVAECS
jgi:SNF2 family DNA or RNA helicase